MTSKQKKKTTKRNGGGAECEKVSANTGDHGKIPNHSLLLSAKNKPKEKRNEIYKKKKNGTMKPSTTRQKFSRGLK